MATTHSGQRGLLRSFIDHESSSGLLLIGAAVVALVLANTGASHGYFDLLHRDIAGLPVIDWINDALMAFFFLMVGLEIKREVIEGQLSTWGRRVLPGACAIGGMLVPALAYFLFNHGDATAIRGWAIPTATDIAFALGVLSLLGSRVPASLKIFLTALAILDDLGAILIIAIFYTDDLSVLMLALAAATIVVLVIMNRMGVTALWVYLAIGAVLWFFVFQSGIHATLAGVALAMTVPLRDRRRPERSPLHRLEHGLHGWVAFLIVPLFGLANAGVAFGGIDAANASLSVPLGVAVGLFVGKQIGIFAAAWLLIRSDAVALPAGANWLQLYGVAVLCGIGFTMSLFINLLAFPDAALFVDEAKIGVLVGSVLSAVVGAILVLAGSRHARPATRTA